MKNQWSCSSLLLRIRNQYCREVRYRCLKSIQKMCCSLLLPSIALVTFYFTNQVYNAWKGPFPMNLTEFRTYIETPIYKLDNYTAMYFLRQLLFPSEYIQIELGENAIDESMKNTLYIFDDNESDEKLLYVLNRIVEPSIDTEDIIVFVKFPAYDQSYWKIHYLYNFQSFNISTLQCIVKQFNISLTEYTHWSAKSIYINHIEQIYNNNPEIFNKKVIKKCGILIGYRYQSTIEKVYSTYSHKYFYFRENVRTFNASCSYTCYIAYIIISVFIYFLLINMIEFIPLVSQLISPSFPLMDHSIEKQMKQTNIISLENIDTLLFETSYINNYYNRLFIIYDKYLIILMINFEEKNIEILQQFYEHSPLIILPINDICYVRPDSILVNSYDRQYIHFPICSNNLHFNPANWLHERLMILNEQYRLNWEKRHVQEEEENRHFLELLIREETQYQLNQNRNDINRIWNRITAASPLFIAQFRLSDQLLVTQNRVGTTCNICLKAFQLNQYFVQWPCTAQHMFHFYCMLNVLRTSNTCPLCRHPVESADLPVRTTSF